MRRGGTWEARQDRCVVMRWCWGQPGVQVSALNTDLLLQFLCELPGRLLSSLGPPGHRGESLPVSPSLLLLLRFPLLPESLQLHLQSLELLLLLFVALLLPLWHRTITATYFNNKCNQIFWVEKTISGALNTGSELKHALMEMTRTKRVYSLTKTESPLSMRNTNKQKQKQGGQNDQPSQLKTTSDGGS